MESWNCNIKYSEKHFWDKVANYDACSHRQQVKQHFLYVILLTSSNYFMHFQNRINTSITNRYNKTEQSNHVSLPFFMRW